MRSIKGSFSVIALMTIVALCSIAIFSVQKAFAGVSPPLITVSEGTVYYSENGYQYFPTEVKGISYDYKTQTLTLNNYSGDFLNLNNIKINLNVIGENHLEHISGRDRTSLTITGNGKLVINENKIYKNAILLNGSEMIAPTLKIEGMVELKAFSSDSNNPVFAVHGSISKEGIISINNATDKITAENYNPPQYNSAKMVYLEQMVPIEAIDKTKYPGKYYTRKDDTFDSYSGIYEELVSAGTKGLSNSIVVSVENYEYDKFDFASVDQKNSINVYRLGFVIDDSADRATICKKSGIEQLYYLYYDIMYPRKYYEYEIIADCTDTNGINDYVAVSTGNSFDSEGDFENRFRNWDIPSGYTPLYYDTEKEYYNVTVNTDYFENKPAPVADIERIYGAGRYDTAISAADQLLKAKGIDKHENIIVASGENFPDALAGGYLAKVKNAPILLITQAEEQRIANEIFNKLQPGGTVYLLGGTNAVSENFETYLKENGIKTQRLGGAGRYETNMLILKAAGVQNEDLLICTGTGFADSLSASAAGKPIFLVGDSLTDAQQNYLQSLHPGNIYLIGGTAVVSDNIKSEISAITGKTGIRVAGDNRYATSVEVAKTFCNHPEVVTLVYALNFPDGLSGSPLAMAFNAPILLVTDQQYASAMQYSKSNGVTNALVLGGPSLIPDSVARQFVQ